MSTFLKQRKQSVMVLLFLLFGSTALAQDNGVMMQYFHWYLPSNGTLWTELENNAADLNAAGITAIWMPPSYKGMAGGLDVGYGVYDLYDMGEFNQKGSIRTKYGTRAQYEDAISALQNNGINVYGDVVFNHKAGADDTEWFNAIRCDSNNRNNQYGASTYIEGWTEFTFPGRGNTYSSFEWHWWHFDGVDWAQNLQENTIFRIDSTGKGWDWEVDTEFGNYDYLMHADVDFSHPEVISELKTWGEWYVNTFGIDGFRIDAIKHIRYDFFADWLGHVRTQTGKELFTVGEFWSYDIGRLHNYITKSSGVMSLFDAPLHLKFYNASNSGGGYDMRYILDGTLMKEAPALAVTLVENHDTQPCQALESPVQDWFKPLAYAIILLRAEGYPNVFYADYYGATYSDCGNITMASHKTIIDKLLAARRDYAYGTQRDYFNHHDIIGWTRLGDANHPEAMAVVVSDGPGGNKWMDTDKANATFVDVTGNHTGTVTTNSGGEANFPVNGGSVSVWVSNGTPTGGNNVDLCFECNNGTTYWGQNVYVVGSIPELGNWDPNQAVKLDPNNYPTWDGTINVPDQNFEWKCIKKDGGNVVWQGGSNNTYSQGTSNNCTSGSF